MPEEESNFCALAAFPLSFNQLRRGGCAGAGQRQLFVGRFRRYFRR
jgi:hypothetical protein